MVWKKFPSISHHAEQSFQACTSLIMLWFCLVWFCFNKEGKEKMLIEKKKWEQKKNQQPTATTEVF